MAVASLNAAGGPLERRKNWLEQRLGPDNYRIVRGLARNPLSVAGVILISIFFIIAILAPVLAPPVALRPNEDVTFMISQIPRDGFSEIPRAPMSAWTSRPPKELPFWYQALTGQSKWVHLMGTASGQWDIWYGMVWGTRVAIIIGVAITMATVTIGMIVGSISAYYGGTVDMIMQRITEVFMAFPFLLAALVLAAVLSSTGGKGILPATIALTTFGWMGYARLIRGDILSTKERDYVLAARTIGVRDGGILVRHIIPNAVYPTLVVASLEVGSYVLSFAALSFLGVGTEPGYPDWGQIISFARQWIANLADYWWIVTYPAFALVFFGLGWNLVGDGIRDVMDPRLKGRGG
jgi:peptide/nickel transport system permease protein